MPYIFRGHMTDMHVYIWQHIQSAAVVYTQWKKQVFPIFFLMRFGHTGQ